MDAILAGTPRHWRRCGGYNLDRFVDGASFRYPRDPRFNLAKMISGSEGTLAVMTELKLGVVDLPTRTGLAVVHFDSLHEALSSVPAMLETRPSAIELLDNLGLTLCRGVPQYARLLSSFVEGNPDCVLITEFRGESEAELRASVDNLQRHLTRQGVRTHTVAAIDPQVQSNVWTVRKVGLGLMMSIKGDYKPIPFIEDAAVPPQYLADYVTEIQRFCKEVGTERVAMYAHASAGCLHIRPLINTKLAADLARLPKIASFAAELLGRYGGSLSSEHGDGRARSWLNEQFFGRELYELYRQAKGIFDPAGILNPGQVVDAPPMTRDLRYGVEYQALQQPEHLDFSSDQGFDRAIEMCNGAGICRKKTEGTMCPSFMVTREEEHSTRGRANLLRAAMSGRLPAAELTGERIYAAMEPVHRVQGVQGGVPLVGGYGQGEVRIPGALLRGQSGAGTGALLCRHRPRQPGQQRLARADRECPARRRAGAPAAGEGARDQQQAHAAALRRAAVHALVRRARRGRRRWRPVGSGAENGAARAVERRCARGGAETVGERRPRRRGRRGGAQRGAVQRHLQHLQRPGGGDRRRRGAGGRRLPRGAARPLVLRAPHGVQGLGGAGARRRPYHRRQIASAGRPGHAGGGPGAELHPHPEGRVPVPAAGRPQGGRGGRRGVDVRGVRRCRGGGGPLCAAVPPPRRDGCCCTATATRRRWSAPAPATGRWNWPATRWTRWTPAAAAWPARSATRRSTWRCRWRWPSAACYPPSAPPARPP